MFIVRQRHFAAYRLRVNISRWIFTQGEIVKFRSNEINTQTQSRTQSSHRCQSHIESKKYDTVAAFDRSDSEECDVFDVCGIRQWSQVTKCETFVFWLIAARRSHSIKRHARCQFKFIKFIVLDSYRACVDCGSTKIWWNSMGERKESISAI